MKTPRLYVATLFTMLFYTVLPAQKTQIKGQLSHADGLSHVFITRIVDAKDIFKVNWSDLDSAVLDRDGTFTFTKLIDGNDPYLYLLYVDQGSPSTVIRNLAEDNYIFIAPDSDELFITGDARSLFETYTITDTRSNRILSTARNAELPIHAKVKYLFTLIKEAGDDAHMIDSIRAVYFDMLIEQYRDVLIPAYDTLVPKTEDVRVLAVMMYIQDEFSHAYQIGDSRTILNRMIEFAPNHAYTKYWREVFEKRDTIMPVGTKFPDITFKDSTGQLITLSQVKGKLILVDFWASWCGPCRNENRTVVKPLHEQYKNEGFAVYGVSSDFDYDSWINAVNKDQLGWIQVRDEMAGQSPMYRKTKVLGLPTTFLLSSDMTILAKNLRDERLVEFVENFFAEESEK